MPNIEKELDYDRLNHLEKILKISKEVSSLDSLDEILETLVKAATDEVGAERGSLFLHDTKTNELYSRVALHERYREIRILDKIGIAGAVFQSGESAIIHDTYSDERFDSETDEKTGFKTRSMICTPVRNAREEVVGVSQVLNKINGTFTENDLRIVDDITTQCANALLSMQMVEKSNADRAREMEFLQLVSNITSELDLSTLLNTVMLEASRMLDADRSTLFLNDEKSDELFSVIGQGLETTTIRFPNHIGIAGGVFTTGNSVNIPHAYADLRFNPAFDKQTGYFTRSILCVPVVSKSGKIIGVTQTINKNNGVFTNEDERRLKAFTAQISVGIENAKLFEDVQQIKNYNESILQSMSNGVVTFDESGEVRTCNAAAGIIMKVTPKDVIGIRKEHLVGEVNKWLLDVIDGVSETRTQELVMDAEIKVFEEMISGNITVLPIDANDGSILGTMLIIEDISSEKRVKATMSRYMDPALANQLLDSEAEEELVGGREVEATILFSDIRGFTTITESLGAKGTVALLNEYFELMVKCIDDQKGMLDKFIGDAIVAAFGIPAPLQDNPDRALTASINMLRTVRLWGKERLQKGLLPIDMGIGLNTDVIVAGNIGSKKRVDYTVIGDGVNLAARLEGACKQYNAKIILSEYTRDKLNGVYRLREIDRVIVKGKTEPVSILESLDFYEEIEFPNVMDVVGYFNEGVAYYRKQDWDKAIDRFSEALKANPDDGVSKLYVDRCKIMELNPPDKMWDGVWIMAEK